MSHGTVWRLAAPAAAAVLGLAGCSWLGIGQPAAASGNSTSTGNAQSCSAKPTTARRYLGLAMPSWTNYPAGATTFADLVGRSPNMVVYYASFGQPFNATLTCAIAKSGALPVIQIDPDHTSVAKIGAGFYDTYLANYAEAVRKFRGPVVISFAHEMNGNWYPWGPPKTSPSSVVAAWRQIHDVFDATGATNVIWLWTPNILYSVSPPLSDYYPGNSYVNWVGIDGYFRLPGETFQSVFGATLQQVTELTDKPILIAETGVADVPGSGLEVDSLFSGVESRQMLGLVWFNSRGSLDWRLEDDPRALAAFRTQARTGW